MSNTGAEKASTSRSRAERVPMYSDGLSPEAQAASPLLTAQKSTFNYGRPKMDLEGYCTASLDFGSTIYFLVAHQL